LPNGAAVGLPNGATADLPNGATAGLPSSAQLIDRRTLLDEPAVAPSPFATFSALYLDTNRASAGQYRLEDEPSFSGNLGVSHELVTGDF
jgi:hypothetical protein